MAAFDGPRSSELACRAATKQPIGASVVVMQCLLHGQQLVRPSLAAAGLPEVSSAAPLLRCVRRAIRPAQPYPSAQQPSRLFAGSCRHPWPPPLLLSDPSAVPPGWPMVPCPLCSGRRHHGLWLLQGGPVQPGAAGHQGSQLRGARGAGAFPAGKQPPQCGEGASPARPRARQADGT